MPVLAQLWRRLPLAASHQFRRPRYSDRRPPCNITQGRRGISDVGSAILIAVQAPRLVDTDSQDTARHRRKAANRHFRGTVHRASGEQVRHFRSTLQLNFVGFYSTQVPSSDVTVHCSHGLPVITIPLPSRNERCQFTIKPLSTTLGKFLKDIQNEDQGIERIAAVSTDGTIFSASTLMNVLLMSDFHLVINHSKYHVQCHPKDMQPNNEPEQVNSVKSLVHGLYSSLRLEEHQLNKEQELLEKLECLREELLPLEQTRSNLMAKSDARTKLLMWTGLALLSTQGGALGYLTWWVYSWDIMEPVTYFITYGNVIAFYAYYLLTSIDYTYPDARDRQFLHLFYKRANRQFFDVEKYNQLRNELAKTEESLGRLQNSLKLKLPIEQLQAKE